MSQRPQTTILNLLSYGRDLRLGESIIPPETVRTVRAAQVALTDDGRTTPQSLKNTLPWQRDRFQITGVAATGPSRGGILDFPQGARIHAVSAHARVAPSTGRFSFSLRVNGTPVEFSGSIQQGETSLPAAGTAVDIPPGGVLTADITSAGDAEDVTINIHYGGL